MKFRHNVIPAVRAWNHAVTTRDPRTGLHTLSDEEAMVRVRNLTAQLCRIYSAREPRVVLSRIPNDSTRYEPGRSYRVAGSIVIAIADLRKPVPILTAIADATLRIDHRDWARTLANRVAPAG